MIAIIPAKGQSQRLPRKNLRTVGDTSLVERAIRTAQEADVFRMVIVSTDDRDIVDLTEQCGAVPYIRPPELRGPSISVADVCWDVVGTTFADAFAVLLPTSPLRTPEDIRGAVEMFDGDTVMSVTKTRYPPERALVVEDGYLQQRFDEPMTQTQDYPTTYRHDGTTIVCDRGRFMETRDFYAGRVKPYAIPPERAVDVDTEMDLQLARFLHERDTA